jgi:gluconolactonase
MREVARGLGLLEGPVWIGDGRVVVTSVTRGVLYEIDVRDGETRVLAESGGNPNGLARDSDGVLWVAQNGGAIIRSRSRRVTPAGVQRVADGDVEDVVSGFDKPNDCAIAPDGRLWFTDPRGNGTIDEFAPQPGRVCALHRTTFEVEVVFDGPLFPNGLAFGPDPDELFLAESAGGRILRTRRSGDGFSRLTEFCALDGEPDGLAFDREGNLYAAVHGKPHFIAVIDPSGRIVDRIMFGDEDLPTNICFGGDDLSTLFITVGKGGRVMASDRSVAGLPLL